MKIEISDALFEQYKQLIKENFLSDDISKSIEDLIEKELRKFCVSGYELDWLTGLKTRFQLESDLRAKLWESRNAANSILKEKYLCIDIDNFRSYVDFYGLTAGDQILKGIAEQLKEKYSEANIYRFGGDDFVVELETHLFIPLEVDKAINLKYSIVEVSVQRTDRSSHILGLIMLNLDRGIIEASKNITKIECKYP